MLVGPRNCFAQRDPNGDLMCCLLVIDASRSFLSMREADVTTKESFTISCRVWKIAGWEGAALS